jgi:hypothetical protein
VLVQRLPNLRVVLDTADVGAARGRHPCTTIL